MLSPLLLPMPHPADAAKSLDTAAAALTQEAESAHLSAEQHRRKRQRRQKVQQQRIADRTVEKGLVIVHTGNGKGKTTAALGMVLRSLGHGYKVATVQFIN